MLCFSLHAAVKEITQNNNTSNNYEGKISNLPQNNEYFSLFIRAYHNTNKSIQLFSNKQ